jgi:hypothetical protein
MNPLTLVPAYGRDYKSKAAVIADWNADKDFQINSMFHPDDGRYINKPQADAEGITAHIRYKALTRIAVINPETVNNA